MQNQVWWGRITIPAYNKILVTGGLGFIGSHTVDNLLEGGSEVTVLDNLDPQVHPRRRVPNYANQGARILIGDVRDRKLVRKALRGVEAVIHLAADVGVGQSMYEIEKFIDSNTRGTAVLLDVLANEKQNVKKVVVASSMSVYGEGKYYCENCNSVRYPSSRRAAPERKKTWDPICDTCHRPLAHLGTDEETPLSPTSIYAMSKRHQEEMCLLVGRTYGISTVALRFFNTYGSRQALSNPYTGAAAIFISRILGGKPPFIFEDGLQLRDFIHVSDIVRAIILSVETDRADQVTINLGTGKPTSVLEVAKRLLEICESNLRPVVSRQFRKGDVRHCYANVSRARELLGFQAEINLDSGLEELVESAKRSSLGMSESFGAAMDELEARNLTAR